MIVEVKIPEVGESITEATIAEWLKQSGDVVARDEVLLSLETDKATVEVVAENAGKLEIKTQAGETVEIGAVVATIDTDAKAEAGAPAAPTAADTPPPPPQEDAPPPAPAAAPAAPSGESAPVSPAAKAHAATLGVETSSIQGSGKDGRVMKPDVLNAAKSGAGTVTSQPASATPTTPPAAPKRSEAISIIPEGEREKRVPMSTIRKKIAQRLVDAQHTAAILTTFNEVDMTAIFDIRKRYKDAFKEKYGMNLGFMGFFTKAVTEALKEVPAVNASIDGDDIVYKNYCNVGIAVSSDKGLMVPVIKDADMLSIAGLEREIRAYAKKARDGKISISDLSGGTFTITNGGVFGSLNSTPILTPPQVGILGMHKVQERPMAIDGKVEIRPMMYLALSYDHRMIDGKEAVTFLVKVKEMVEDPNRMLIEV